MLATEAPFPQFFDLDGTPLDSGSLYFGQPDQNPEINPVTVYWDAAGTQPAAQPLATLNGYVVRAGSPALVYAASDYSLTVRNRKLELLYYAPSAADFSNAFLMQSSAGAGNIGFSYALTYVAGSIGRWLKDLALAAGAGFIGWKQSGPASQLRTVQDKLREVSYSVADELPPGFDPTTTNCAGYINAALTGMAARGGGDVVLGQGRYAISQPIQIPDKCGLVGQGRAVTEIYLLTGANVNLVQKAAGATGIGARLMRLQLNGNDAGNTGGGLYWQGPNVGRGPSLTMDNVRITACRPAAGSGVNSAVVLEGGTWGVLRDVDIDQNQNAIGLWHKGSDWLFDGLYLGPNGATANGGSGGQNMIVQGGAGNIFTGGYFGGNGGLEQVLLLGSQRNTFVGCFNDNAWEAAYRFADFSGQASSFNTFSGGQISHAGGKTNNTFDAVSLEGGATGNVFGGMTWIGDPHTSSGNRARYAIAESGTASGNVVVGGWTGNNYGTRFKNLLAGTATVVRNLVGFTRDGASADRGDASVTLTVGTDAQLQRFATALTANRTVTLSALGASNGDTFKVVRTGLGAFTLDVGGLKTIPAATAAFVDVMHDGTAWRLTGYGAL